MWRCLNCGAKGFEPVWKTENLGFKENPYYEDEAHCPHCGSGNVEDAEAIRERWVNHLVYKEKCRLLSGTASKYSVHITKEWEKSAPHYDEWNMAAHYAVSKHEKERIIDTVERVAVYYGVPGHINGLFYQTKPNLFSISVEYHDGSHIKTIAICNIDYAEFKKIFCDLYEAGCYPTVCYADEEGNRNYRSNSSLGSLRMYEFKHMGLETDDSLARELAELGFDEEEFRKEKEAEYDS